MTQHDKSAPDVELVKLIYHTAHKTAEDKGIPIPTVVTALVHAASVMAQIYDCHEIFDSAVKVNRLEASRLEELRGGYQDEQAQPVKAEAGRARDAGIGRRCWPQLRAFSDQVEHTGPA